MTAAGVVTAMPVGQVGRAQLLVARQRHRTDAEAGQQRLHPLDPVADQQQYDVAAAYADLMQGAGKPRAAFGQRCEGVFPAVAAVRAFDDRDRLGRRRLHHVPDEVHGLSPGRCRWSASGTVVGGGHLSVWPHERRTRCGRGGEKW
jgi:hypothetical protein